MPDELERKWRQVKAADRAGAPAATIVLARELVALAPDLGPAWNLLGRTLVSLARYREGEAALRRAIALCPPERSRIPLAEMGHSYEGQGRCRLAARWYQRAIDADPDHAGSRIHLGGVLARMGRLHEAEVVHRAATQCERGCIDEAWLNLGLVLRALERYDEAAECLEKAIELDPRYREAKAALRDVRRVIKLTAKPEATA